MYTAHRGAGTLAGFGLSPVSSLQSTGASIFQAAEYSSGICKISVSSVPGYYGGAGQPESRQILEEVAQLWMRLGRQALSGFVKFQKQVTLPKMPKIKDCLDTYTLEALI